MRVPLRKVGSMHACMPEMAGTRKSKMNGPYSCMPFVTSRSLILSLCAQSNRSTTEERANERAPRGRGWNYEKVPASNRGTPNPNTQSSVRDSIRVKLPRSFWSLSVPVGPS
ncbi:hypothetical protein VNO80_02687 [Phaseolus coccineus]|uniref:Uncharacterized protein n=1 Tax=Phaseolus coccineus TaxID=3886 RepID=A0AAN9NQ47_PHACN